MKVFISIFTLVIISTGAHATSKELCKNEALRYSNVIYRADYKNTQDVSVTAKFVKHLSDETNNQEVWKISFVRNDGYLSAIWSHVLTLVPEKSTDKLNSSQCILVNFDREDYLLYKDNLKETR